MLHMFSKAQQTRGEKFMSDLFKDVFKPLDKNKLRRDIFTDNPYTKQSLEDWYNAVKKGENPAEIDAKLISELLRHIKEIEIFT